ncbi:unnamed protein product [Owenia fusiformis]|uniref:CATSPERD beta-propeller domain-containing protein n=1 Tax=Owenia fusiformis TaxID=6347 RepID=A0A8J1YBP3_OWEFU|nr:unnamed protein product [Owenia fusiformis]
MTNKSNIIVLSYIIAMGLYVVVVTADTCIAPDAMCNRYVGGNGTIITPSATVPAHKSVLVDSSSYPEVIPHHCNQNMSIYRHQHIYLSTDFFLSPMEPLVVNTSTIASVTNSVSSVSFSVDDLVMVIGGAVFKYFTNTRSLIQATGIDAAVTDVTTTQCCSNICHWCQETRNLVVAYDRDTAIDKMFLSKDGGENFETLNLTSAVDISGVTVLSSYKSVAVLVKLASTEAKFEVFNYTDAITSSPTVSFTIEGTDLHFLQFRSEFSSLLVWDSKRMFYSPNSGHTVHPIELYPTVSWSSPEFLQSSEKFQQVITDKQGNFAALTNQQRLFFGREGFKAEAVLLSNIGCTLNANSAILFDHLGNIIIVDIDNISPGNKVITLEMFQLDLKTIITYTKPALPKCQVILITCL